MLSHLCFFVSVVHVKRFAMSVEMELYGFTIPFQLYAGFLLDFSHFGCRRFLALACYQSEVSADLHIYIYRIVALSHSIGRH